MGEFLSRIFANPEHQVETDLQRFKEGVERGQQFETGAPRARPNVGHGTPGGTLGSLNETDNRAQERTSEKSDDRLP